MSTSWPNDPRIDCKWPFQLVKLIEKDLDFEELENFKDWLIVAGCCLLWIDVWDDGSAMAAN